LGEKRGRGGGGGLGSGKTGTSTTPTAPTFLVKTKGGIGVCGVSFCKHLPAAPLFWTDHPSLILLEVSFFPFFLRLSPSRSPSLAKPPESRVIFATCSIRCSSHLLLLSAVFSPSLEICRCLRSPVLGPRHPFQSPPFDLVQFFPSSSNIYFERRPLSCRDFNLLSSSLSFFFLSILSFPGKSQLLFVPPRPLFRDPFPFPHGQHVFLSGLCGSPFYSISDIILLMNALERTHSIFPFFFPTNLPPCSAFFFSFPLV